MRIFNRIVVILLLAGLFVLGVYAIAYAFNLFGKNLNSLLNPIKSFGSGAQGFMGSVESGNLPVLTIILLVLIALLGLILLILELKPRTPSRVRMEKGTFLTRGVVQEEVSRAVEQSPDVLGHSVKARAQRRPGAQVDLEARVRRGEDTGAIQRSLRRQVQEHLGGRGVPVSKLNVKTVEADPRQTKTRVQ
jgi:preprotein translocase subunit SecG